MSAGAQGPFEEGLGEEQTASVEADMKVCPDCAEAVQAGARVCRYCGFRFDAAFPGSGSSAASHAHAAPEAEKSVAAATVLSLVIPGLGHFYLGEGWRGGVLLATFLLAVIGGLATGHVGPAPIVGIVGAIDAYNGAGELRETGRLRPIGTGLLIMLAIVVVLVTVAVVRAPESTSGSAASYEGCVAANLLPPEECAASYGSP